MDYKGNLLRAVLLLILLSIILALVIAIRTQMITGTSEPIKTGSFFEQFVINGGPIVWFVLFPMSLVTVFLAAEHFLTIRRKKLLPSDTNEEITETIQNFGFKKLEEKIFCRDDLVSTAVLKAFKGGRGDFFRMRNLLAESLQDQASELLRKIEWLNLIGNVSPMVGLFGTVFGMIKLFNAIVNAGGQPQPAQLANGISVALVTTFWGLFIAIPALAIHGVLKNRIEELSNEAAIEAEDIMPEIRRCLKIQIEAKAKEKKQAKQRIEEIKNANARVSEKSAKS